MKNTSVSILINPYNNKPLVLKNGNDFLTDHLGNIVPIVNGIPNFLALEETKDLNLKYQKFYDKISRLNDIAEVVYSLFYDLKKLRSDWMKDVEVQENWNVLETSVGTGWNFKVLPKNANYFGLDISAGMLKQAQKNQKKWGIPMELFQGNAEYLPFANNSFDSVFHVGGINFFNNRERAILEMIRVAKPNTKIVIIDETEEKIQQQYRKTPLVRRYFSTSDIDQARTVAPVDLVPKTMKDIEVKLLDKGKMYQLSFRTI